MATIKCSGGGCDAVFHTTEAISPKATYTCKAHTSKNEDKTRFQGHQFDKDLDNGSGPIGTNHIPDSRTRPQGFRPASALKSEENESDGE